MTATAETIPEAVGDWTLRGLDVDQVFARPELSDDALTAACLTTARFDPAFPGWQLYRRIVAGFTMFDAELDEWAVGVGRGPSSPAWPRDQSRHLSPNASGGLTPLSPPSELQEIPVAIREQSGVLGFHSRGMPVSPGASGMQPRDPCRPWRGTLASGHKPR